MDCHALRVRNDVFVRLLCQGNYTVASDVDLLVVYQGQENEQSYAIVKQAFGIPRLEPHVYTEEEYGTARDTINKMTTDGVVIYPL